MGRIALQCIQAIRYFLFVIFEEHHVSNGYTGAGGVSSPTVVPLTLTPLTQRDTIWSATIELPYAINQDDFLEHFRREDRMISRCLLQYGQLITNGAYGRLL